MDVVKTSMLLLLLAAVGAIADPSPENCGGLNVTLHEKDLHKIFGDWVLVWSVTDHETGLVEWINVTSSHVEFRLLPDNHTVTFSERNVFPTGKCKNYFVNFTMPAEDSTDHTLHHVGGKIEDDGVFSDYNQSGEMHFFETCEECMVMVYKSTEGRFLLIYRKDGHHQDVDKAKEHHENHNKLAECLGFPHEQIFIYDGVADFCHKKSAPEAKVAADHVEPAADSLNRMDVVKTSMLLLLLAAVGAIADPSPENCGGLNVTLHEKDLHKIFADWVLVWSVMDQTTGLDEWINFTSSHVELRLLPDNHTVTFSERNVFPTGKCKNYFINFTMPAEDSTDHTLHHVGGKIEEDDVFSDYNQSGEIHFFETCDECMVMVYKSTEGRFLLIYRKDGHHQDVDKAKEHHENHNKLAECLGFPHEQIYIYDGVADFCHKKSAPEAKVAADHVEPAADSLSRMDVVKTSMLLLLLAAVGAIADPSPENCGGLNVTLHEKDLHKIFGDWVLVWSVLDNWINFTSSHVEFRLLPDNHTVTFSERNVFPTGKCRNYFINFTMPAEDSTDHTLHHVGGKIEEDGVFSDYNQSGEIHFFETCDECMVMVYKSTEGRFLLIYRKDGHHQDVDKAKEHHENHNKLAECLGFPHEQIYIYDGVADFCHKKSAPEAKVPADHVEPAADVKPAES
ncbi:saxitoxin and tetrodotoxin-binding protein 1-like [Centropristis striata]|uniref:saxitoxin and tetrodotoxin-binding protein 1-like n=1 Tax=Centropristis striata TaxID=184440 RepID=UPI0027E19A70|nr:saxitoxin and tetrodotoxin-binding protein 1-like [Centropristis striata]